jgi:hypothetical protein
MKLRIKGEAEVIQGTDFQFPPEAQSLVMPSDLSVPETEVRYTG